MTNLPPPGSEPFREGPPEPPPASTPRRIDSLGFKELVGVVVAFTTIGTILFWSLGREREGFDLANLPFPLASPSAPPTPTLDPSATLTPTPGALTPEDEPGRSESRVGPERVGPQAVGPRAAGPQPPQPVNFSDVPGNYWARPFILALAERGVISGFNDGTFKPNQPVTRAEFATFLDRAFNRNPAQNPQAFKDISANFWAAPSIDRATRTGFMQGYPGDIFRPTQPIPRVQALVSLVSGLGLAGQPAPNQMLQTYRDAGQIPKWATNKVAAATQAGLVVNHPDQKLLKPSEFATRADAAALIYQALVTQRQAEPINSPYIVQPGRQPGQ